MRPLDASTADCKYRDATFVGSGSSCDLYRAYDSDLDRTVAIKVLRQSNGAMADRMLREARALAKLRHDGICQVFEVGTYDGRPFIAMQFVEGVDLAAAAVEADVETKVRWAIDVAEALAHAHAHGFVHRDIKPSNILVTAAGRAVVIDFGLVREAAGARATSTGQLVGTPSYMAPEQAAGEPRGVDSRADVHGLGATLFELLSGRPPFRGHTALDVMWKVRHEVPDKFRHRAPGVSRSLEAVVLCCLEKDPRHRYASMSDLADDLRRVLEAEPVRARRYRVGRSVRRSLVRHRHAARLGLVVALGAAAVAGAWRHLDRSAATGAVPALVQEASALGLLMRTAHQQPLHDLRRSKARVEGRMAAVETLLDDPRPGVAASAHYALGRGHLALEQPGPARAHLEKSWAAGFETPEASFALGLAYSKLAELEVGEIDMRLASTQRRRARRDALAELGPKLGRYLDLSRRSDTLPVAYLDGLTRLYEEDFAAADALAVQALSDFPWLHEARVLRGRIAARQAEVAVIEGDLDRAQKFFEVAEEHFQAATAAAPSSPAARLALCRLETARVKFQRGAWFDEVDIAAAREACRQARRVDSEASRPFSLGAEVELAAAGGLDLFSKEYERLLGRAEELARVAIELAPKDLHAMRLMGSVLSWQAETMVDRADRDPSSHLELAETFFSSVLERSPAHIDALVGMGYVEMMRSYRGRPDGAEVMAAYRSAVRWFSQAAAAAPDAVAVNLHLGNAHLHITDHALYRGFDCEENARQALDVYDRARRTLGEGSSASLPSALARLRLGLIQAHQGGDPTPLFDQADALLETVDLGRVDAEVVRWHQVDSALTRARVAMLTDRPPGPALARARRLLDASTNGRHEFEVQRFDLEILSLRWALREGRSALEPLARVRELLASSGWLDLTSARADWLLKADVFAAAAHVERGLDARPQVEAAWGRLHPRLVETPTRGLWHAYSGLLLLLEARIADDPELRRRQASASVEEFEAAIQLNRWLELEVRHHLELAKRAQASPGGPNGSA